MTNIIEPCCCHRQLPELLRKNKDKVCVFYTSGDVTVQKFGFAVSYMAGHNSERWLMLPKVDVPILRMVRNDILKGWANRYTLLLSADCGLSEEEIGRELDGVGDSVTVLYDEMVRCGMFAMTGTDATVVIVGDMLSKMDAGLKPYTAFFGTDHDTKAMLLETVRSRIYIKNRANAVRKSLALDKKERG